MEEGSTFCEWLTARRKALGLSQSGAARKAGVSRLTWIAWETCKSTPMDYNYVRIEHAMRWGTGDVERAIRQGVKPTELPERGEEDLRDAVERRLWGLKRLTVDEKWMYIDRRRKSLAEAAAIEAEADAAARARNQQNSA